MDGVNDARGKNLSAVLSVSHSVRLIHQLLENSLFEKDVASLWDPPFAFREIGYGLETSDRRRIVSKDGCAGRHVIWTFHGFELFVREDLDVVPAVHGDNSRDGSASDRLERALDAVPACNGIAVPGLENRGSDFGERFDAAFCLNRA